MKNHVSSLTNEKLKKKFTSFFNLANYGMKVAKEMMMQNQEVNLAMIMNILEDLPNLEKA